MDSETARQVRPFAAIVTRHTLRDSDLRKLPLVDKAGTINNMATALTIGMIDAASLSSPLDMNIAFAALLNTRTNDSRQHWYVDSVGRLGFHDAFEVCEKCGFRSHLEMQMVNGVVVCTDCALVMPE